MSVTPLRTLVALVTVAGLALLVARCKPKKSPTADEFITVTYSKTAQCGVPPQECGQLVADGRDFMTITVKLPDDVLPKKVKIETTLGTFGQSSGRTAEATTDPRSFDAQFVLHAGTQAGLALITVSVTATVDRQEQIFSVNSPPVNILRSCPDFAELQPVTPPTLKVEDNGSLRINAQAFRREGSLSSGVRFDFTATHETEGKSAGLLVVDGSPISGEDGKVSATLFVGPDAGNVTVKAIASCFPDVSSDASPLTVAAPDLMVTYTTDATTTPP